MLCGWKGNRTSGVEVAMPYRLKKFIRLQVQSRWTTSSWRMVIYTVS